MEGLTQLDWVQVWLKVINSAPKRSERVTDTAPALKKVRCTDPVPSALVGHPADKVYKN